MPRPRSFDKDVVLKQVMILFWEKGYCATSMMDIREATGLKPGSIYESFGDKHQLFLMAMDHYRQNVVRRRLDNLLQPGPARPRIETFFEDLITFSLGEGRKLGCLMSNTAVEMAPHDDECRHVVQDNLVEIADAFYQVVSEGQDSGEFNTKEKPEDIARFLTSTIQGLRVMAKSQTTEETMRTSARLALQILD